MSPRPALARGLLHWLWPTAVAGEGKAGQGFSLVCAELRQELAS